ncbi:MAG: diaminopimelate epimerase [Alphaproteobacteria bacterium]
MTPVYRFGEALGNCFLLIDYRSPATPKMEPKEWIAFAKDEQRCIDQLIEIHPNHLVFYNQDGSSAEACGNGTRCAALWLSEDSNTQKTWHLETAGGPLQVHVHDRDNIAVTFPAPEHKTMPDFKVNLPLLAPPDVVTIGNPHLVLWLADHAAVDIHHWGPILEHSFPERINVSFAVRENKETISLKVWERGAGATQACGTAACATHVSALCHGFVGDTSCVQQIGGKLSIHWPGPGNTLTLTGPATLE